MVRVWILEQTLWEKVGISLDAITAEYKPENEKGRARTGGQLH